MPDAVEAVRAVHPGRLVQLLVDARDARRDQLRGLTAFVRVHGRTADLALFPFHLGAAVDGVAVSVEETAGELIADFQGRGSAQEGDFRVGGDALRSGEHLQGDGVALGLHHLGQTAVHGGQLIVRNACRTQGNGGFRDGFQLRIDSLIYFICHCFPGGY